MGSPAFHPHEIIWTPELIGRFWDYFVSNPNLEWNYFNKHSGRFLAEFVDGVIGLRGKRVLDYGCGPGYLLEHLLNMGITCEGVDFSKNTVETANRRLGGNSLFKGAHWASELPTSLTANRYEVIFFIEVLEHLPPDLAQPTLTELHRLAADGAHVVVTTPNAENLDENKIMCPECGSIFSRWQHVESYDVARLAGVMAAPGFDTLVCQPIHFGSRRKGFKAAIKRLLSGKWLSLVYQPLYLPNIVYIGKKSG